MTTPEVVAWGVRDTDGTMLEATTYRHSAEGSASIQSAALVPLVTLPDALTHAEAQAREAEARIVAWLRLNRNPEHVRWDHMVTDDIADAIERNQHRA